MLLEINTIRSDQLKDFEDTINKLNVLLKNVENIFNSANAIREMVSAGAYFLDEKSVGISEAKILKYFINDYKKLISILEYTEYQYDSLSDDEQKTEESQIILLSEKLEKIENTYTDFISNKAYLNHWANSYATLLPKEDGSIVQMP